MKHLWQSFCLNRSRFYSQTLFPQCLARRDYDAAKVALEAATRWATRAATTVNLWVAP